MVFTCVCVEFMCNNDMSVEDNIAAVNNSFTSHNSRSLIISMLLYAIHARQVYTVSQWLKWKKIPCATSVFKGFAIAVFVVYYIWTWAPALMLMWVNIRCHICCFFFSVSTCILLQHSATHAKMAQMTLHKLACSHIHSRFCVSARFHRRGLGGTGTLLASNRRCRNAVVLHQIAV